jgi:hypothetical protein
MRLILLHAPSCCCSVPANLCNMLVPTAVCQPAPDAAVSGGAVSPNAALLLPLLLLLLLPLLLLLLPLLLLLLLPLLLLLLPLLLLPFPTFASSSRPLLSDTDSRARPLDPAAAAAMMISCKQRCYAAWSSVC